MEDICGEKTCILDRSLTIEKKVFYLANIMQILACFIIH